MHAAAAVHGGQAGVAAQAVALVHHQVADGQLRQVADVIADGAPPSFARRIRASSQYQGVGYHPCALRAAAERKAIAERRDHQAAGCLGGAKLRPAVHPPCPQVAPRQQLGYGGQAARRCGAYKAAPRLLQGGRQGRALICAPEHRRQLFGLAKAARAIQPQARKGPRRARQLRRRQEQRGGGRERPPGVVPVLVMAPLCLLPERLRRALQVARFHQQAIRRQIAVQTGGAVVKQRQPGLGTLHRPPAADVDKCRALARVSGERFVPAVLESLQGIGVQPELARRHAIHLVQSSAGALALRVKGADAVYAIVQQVQAQRRISAHGIEVHERAAHAELAVLHHCRPVLVSGAHQAPGKGIAVQPLADAQRQQPPADKMRRGQALHQAGDGGHQEQPLAGQQPRQQLQARRYYGAMWREAVVGQGLVVGEQCGTAKGLQRPHPTLGAGHRFRHQQHAAPLPAGAPRQGQSRRPHGHGGPASALPVPRQGQGIKA